ncbi:hypothetical protein HY440_03050 [Candidatus Microgenomates bacterium]|nr:hypothetical protein [Candidatus Microgenomates bacterium]
MDKEKLITVAIGLGVGILAAALYFAAVKFLPNLSSNSPKVNFTAPAPSASPEATSLKITSPDDNATVQISPVTITGQATPQTTLVIFANADEKVATADGEGKFSVDIKLEDGANEISISSLDNTAVRETVNRTVTLEIKL